MAVQRDALSSIVNSSYIYKMYYSGRRLMISQMMGSIG
jgi:hypothetical protein